MISIFVYVLTVLTLFGLSLWALHTIVRSFGFPPTVEVLVRVFLVLVALAVIAQRLGWFGAALRAY